MLDKFYTNKYDNETVLVTDTRNYTYKDLKSYIKGAIKIIKNKKQNIIISEDNNFNFIIKFFACIFAKKTIYLLSDLKKIQDFDEEYDLFEENNFEEIEVSTFDKIDEKNTIINFFTSGSTSKPKSIKKSLYNLIKEGQDLGREFNTSNMTVLSSTTMCHLFGMTFHLMFPLCNNLKIYTPSIFYPDCLKRENAIFVSTPTFLNTIEKHKIKFNIPPKYIITAGSKLNEKVFNYLIGQSKIIEIYGSSETGVISYKTEPDKPFKIFNNVTIEYKGEAVEVTSPYIYENTVQISDNIEINGRNLTLGNRTDRLIKIFDKRISSEELENHLNNNELITESFISKKKDRLTCICALSKEGQNLLINNGINNLKKELKSYLKNYSEIVPSRWKFTDTLPRTKTGKINKELISHIFNLPYSFPVILDRREGNDKIEYDLYFYGECNFFSGHFPTHKIVPGVIQIIIAKELSNTHFNLNLGQGQWKRIKFTNIIEQNKTVTLGLEKTETQICYKFYDKERTYSSGVFLCENVFKEHQCI